MTFLGSEPGFHPQRPVCERDAFCVSEPGHDGECRQPFETEYRVGDKCEVGFVLEAFMGRIFNVREQSIRDFQNKLRGGAKQAGLFS